MSEATGNVTATTTTGSGVTAETSGAGSTSSDDKGANAVIRDLRKRAQDAEAALAEVAKKEEAERQNRLKAAGQFEALETEYKQKLAAAEAKVAELEPVVTDLKAQQTAAREAQIALLPEAHRGIASALPPDKLAEYTALVTGTKGPTIKPDAPGVPVPTAPMTPEQIRDGVAKHGIGFLSGATG